MSVGWSVGVFGRRDFGGWRVGRTETRTINGAYSAQKNTSVRLNCGSNGVSHDYIAKILICQKFRFLTKGKYVHERQFDQI